MHSGDAFGVLPGESNFKGEKKNMKTTAYAILTAALLAVPVVAVPAGAQGGLVNVDVSNVSVDIAKDINVDVSQIPITVQAPIAIAANVCNISANVLASDVNQDGVASCDATTTSRALKQIVARELGLQL
jgi:hypothetical protein